MIVPTPEAGRFHFYRQEYTYNPSSGQWEPGSWASASYSATEVDPLTIIQQLDDALAQSSTNVTPPPYRWWHLWVWGYETTNQGGPIPISPDGSLPVQRVPARWLLGLSFGNFQTMRADF